MAIEVASALSHVDPQRADQSFLGSNSTRPPLAAGRHFSASNSANNSSSLQRERAALQHRCQAPKRLHSLVDVADAARPRVRRRLAAPELDALVSGVAQQI